MKWLCALLLLTGPVLAYDDPANPIYAGPKTTVVVNDSVEFGLNPEGGLSVDVVPAIEEIGPNRISVRTTEGPGQFLRAAFNG